MTEPSDQDVRTSPTSPIEEAAQDWFLRLASEDATEAELTAFQGWCNADPRHLAAYNEIRELWLDIDDLQSVFAPPNDIQGRGDPYAAEAHPDAQEHRSGYWVTSFLSRWESVGGLSAACLALLFVFGAGVSIWLRADYTTSVGEQTTVTLPDGSIAYLNTDTAIALAYSSHQRQIVLLRGEAQFEVLPDPGLPFIVQALKGRTTVVGTTFTVRSWEQTVTVTVTEGTVQVSHLGSQVPLQAGQQVRYGRDAPPMTLGQVELVDPTSMTAWQRGSVVINGLPLPQAIAEIDRYRPGKILLFADTNQLEPVTARLSLQAVDNGLKALAATHGLTVTPLTNYLMLVY